MSRLASFITCSVAALAISLSAPVSLHAQEDHGHSHEGGEHEGHSHAEVVAFRLVEWHEEHFDDANVAALHLKTVQQLGCEADQRAHEGHTDVAYRCTEWKEMTVASHQLAEQWSGWFKAAGFDTHHAHVDESFLHGAETVQIRLADWKTAHMTGADTKDAKAFTQALTKLGCAVTSHAHGDHADVTYRCPTWVTVHVANHAAAEQWQTWLKKHGFETQHTH